jgi:hypothetical protein
LHNNLILAVTIIVLLLFALNLACALLFRWKPNLLLSENERLGLDYLARFEEEFKPRTREWFDIAAEDHASAFSRIIAGHIADALPGRHLIDAAAS